MLANEKLIFKSILFSGVKNGKDGSSIAEINPRPLKITVVIIAG